MRKMVAAVLALTLLISLTACSNSSTSSVQEDDGMMGADSAKIRFKVGTTTAPEGHYVKGLQKMQKLLEEYSDCEMTLDIYPNSQLGNERDMMESVGLGVQEMCLISTGPIPNFVSDFAVLDFPYLFEDAEDAYSKLDGELGQELLDELETQKIRGVGFWENGFRELTNDDRVIATPEDLAGMKIRTMENNVHIETYEELGVTATPMAWSEIFTALSQGTVDGQENPIAIIDTSRVWEVQQYISMIDLFYSPCVLMISERIYDGLTKEQQEAFDRSAEEAKDWQREYSQNYNEEAVANMDKEGVTITEVDKEVWKEAVSDVYDMAETFQISQELVDKWTK